MTVTLPQARRLSATVVVLASLALTSGCDKLTNRLGLTGQVSAVAPQPIGPERMRVMLPARGAQATLAPVARSGGTTVWQTLDGITLSFRQGVLVGTRGLGDDLMTSGITNTLAMVDGKLDDMYYPHVRSYLDGEYQTEFRSFQCRQQARSREQTSIGGHIYVTRKIEERCVSPRDEFTNTYWLNTSGEVIKSRQWVSPAIEYMETERVQR